MVIITIYHIQFILIFSQILPPRLYIYLFQISCVLNHLLPIELCWFIERYSGVFYLHPRDHRVKINQVGKTSNMIWVSTSLLAHSLLRKHFIIVVDLTIPMRLLGVYIDISVKASPDTCKKMPVLLHRHQFIFTIVFKIMAVQHD